MRVALTGPEGDRGSLGEGLRAEGVATIGVPLLEVGPGDAGLAAALRRPFDLVVFPSPRAVDAVVSVADAAADAAAVAAGLAPLPFRSVRCLAMGPTTARRAREAGFEVLLEGGEGAGDLLARLDGTLPLAGRRVLLPASDRARPELAEGLRARGAAVEVVVAYSIRPAAGAEDRVGEILRAAPDATLLASPSAAEALAAGLRGRAPPPLLALGETTAAALRGLGLPVSGVAAEPTGAGIRRAMEGRSMQRPRRLRRTPAIRRMVRETRLSPEQLVAPIFVVPGEGIRQPIPSMPGVERVSPDEAAKDAAGLAALGVGGVILFGLPARKDAEGSGAWDPEGPVCTALRAMRGLDLVRWADICLCEYTDHGHCGLLDAAGEVRNDATLPLLARAAVACARAGADAVAPSDMMDGRVGAIRAALDAAGLEGTAIVSYAVKYASALYGPFREAADCAPRAGDRKSYQMDPANAREALREAALDEAEGADVLMVKPALMYLDVIHSLRARTTLPLAAYNVSGEYAMLKAAAERGWIDGERAMLEALLSIRRAGADLVVTYHAAEAARLLGG